MGSVNNKRNDTRRSLVEVEIMPFTFPSFFRTRQHFSLQTLPKIAPMARELLLGFGYTIVYYESL